MVLWSTGSLLLTIIIRRGWANKLFASAFGLDANKSWYFAISEFKNCFIISLPSLFLINIFVKWSNLHFHTRAIARRRRAWFRLHEQNIICSQTQLDDIAQKQTIICRQIFAGHVVGSQPMKRKKNLHRIIKDLTGIHCSIHVYATTAICSRITSSLQGQADILLWINTCKLTSPLSIRQVQVKHLFTPSVINNERFRKSKNTYTKEWFQCIINSKF